MKEPEQKKDTKIENVKQVSIEKKNVLVGRNKLQNGHKVWEYNRETNEIIPATIINVPAKYLGVLKTNNINYFAKNKIQTKGNIEIRPNCYYVPALNKKNVIKSLKRDFGINLT